MATEPTVVIEVETLRKIEWAGCYRQRPACPVCMLGKEDGHLSYCWLGNLLKEASKEVEE